MRLRCNNCRYRWTGRLKTPPKCCPRCRRYTALVVPAREAREMRATPTVTEAAEPVAALA